jgi:uncharacterized alpha-E superfamily protein
MHQIDHRPPRGAIQMLADFEYKFNQHDETIRRAESTARLLAALTAVRSTPDADRPQRRLSTLLRRLAGTAYTAA